MILVRAFPRIHAGLIDMGSVTPRRHGGAGFTLEGPPVEVSAQRGPQKIENPLELDIDARGDVRQLLKRMQRDGRFEPCSVAIRSIPPQHIGLGTKTALLLAILKACEILSGQKILPLELQRLSGRGGVSGIGIHAFFQGGFIIDGGHTVAIASDYAPSSYRRSFQIPSLNARVNIPTNWRFLLCFPPGNRYSGTAERSFFKRNCPIPRMEVYRTVASVYHGLLPAVIEQDLSKLRSSLMEMQACGFKRRELNHQSSSVRSLFHALVRIPNCAVGMSSMGPLLFAIIHADDVQTLQAIQATAKRHGTAVLAASRGRNRGFELA